jgi:toxin-antitoxin system PIN domain toxin
VIVLDVTVIVTAHRADAVGHDAVRGWLEAAIGGHRPVGVPSIVASGFLRIVTHRRAFAVPTPLGTALEQLSALMATASAVAIDPGPRHWGLFADLCVRGRASGNLVPDAYIAALALEQGAELATLDRGFGRFPGLRWSDPLADPATG